MTIMERVLPATVEGYRAFVTKYPLADRIASYLETLGTPEFVELPFAGAGEADVYEYPGLRVVCGDITYTQGGIFLHRESGDEEPDIEQDVAVWPYLSIKDTKNCLEAYVGDKWYSGGYTEQVGAGILPRETECVDIDTKTEMDALSRLLPLFRDAHHQILNDG